MSPHHIPPSRTNHLRTAASSMTAVLLLYATTDGLRSQCPLQVTAGFGIRGVVGSVNAMHVWDPDGAGPQNPMLILGGYFNLAGTVAASNVVAYDVATGSWSALGTGLNSYVNAIATLATGELVVGGNFTNAGGVPASRIASWNGASWSALGSGVGGSFARVDAMTALPSGELAVGGYFTSAGGAPAGGIAAWNGSSWSPLGTGVPTYFEVFSLLTQANGDLVAGGNFDAIGGTVASRIAKWNGSTWSALGGGVTGFGSGGTVKKLAITGNGDLLAAGDFTNAEGNAVYGVALWNGVSWSSTGFYSGSPTAGANALVVRANGEVVVGTTDYAASWNGSTWTSMGTTSIFALAELPNGDLVSDVGIRIGSSWVPLGRGINGRSSAVASLPNGDIVCAGLFDVADNVPANRIARWNGSSWSALGSGLFNGEAYALTTNPAGDLIAGGYFTSIGGVNAKGIARWNGVSWSAFGSGLTVLSDTVNSVAVLPNGNVVAGGSFAGYGNIARWNGTSWTSLGSMNGIVQALVVLANGDLIAGGSFTTAGGLSANYIARWNGVNWSSFGSGLGGGVQALAEMSNGELVAGGTFTTAGGVSANYIARWNGVNWSSLGSGLGGVVSALTVLPNGDLVAGGSFTTASGIGANRLARWNGATWSAFGSGADGDVLALATRTTGGLIAGGSFRRIDGAVSSYMAVLAPSCPASTTPLGTGCTGSGGPNVLTATSLPWIGSTFRTDATGMPAHAFVVATTGFATQSLPLANVLPQGQIGCDLLVAPEFLDLLLPQAGIAHFQVVLPNSLTLVGLDFYHQMLPIEVDQNLTIQTVTATNALAMTIGAL